jgi:hypothetical protein
VPGDRPPSSAWWPILVCIGILLLVIAIFNVTNATTGVALVGAACFFGILARMAQADELQRQLLWHQNRRLAPAAAVRAQVLPGGWQPSISERIVLPFAVNLYEAMDRQSQKKAVRSGVAVLVVEVRPGWLFVQTEDASTEGWVGFDEEKSKLIAV